MADNSAIITDENHVEYDNTGHKDSDGQVTEEGVHTPDQPNITEHEDKHPNIEAGDNAGTSLHGDEKPHSHENTEDTPEENRQNGNVAISKHQEAGEDESNIEADDKGEKKVADGGSNESQRKYQRQQKRRLLIIILLVVGLVAILIITAVLAWYLKTKPSGSAGSDSGSDSRSQTSPSDVRTDVSTDTPMSTSKPGSASAFSAYWPNTQGFSYIWRQVEYDKTWTDIGGTYGASSFTAPSSDVYMICMGAEIGKPDPLSYRLEGSPQSVGISITSDSHNHLESRGRSLMFDIDNGTEIHMVYSGDLHCCLGTSWSIFSLTAAMGPLVAFSVYRNSSWTTPGHIYYDKTLLNTGNGYQVANREFLAPTTGVYYFTISAGLQSGQPVILHLTHNGQRVIELLRTSTTHNGFDMISSATMVSLSQGDRVQVVLINGSLHSSTDFKEVSFSGFLYRPVYGDRQAWSVWRNSSWTAEGSELLPVPYDTELVNLNSMYNTTDHVVSITVSGAYLVNLVAAVSPGIKMSMYIEVGQGPLISGSKTAVVYHTSTNHNGVDTQSHEALLSLEAGQKVWVGATGIPQASNGYGFYSNNNLVTGFTGCLVYTT